MFSLIDFYCYEGEARQCCRSENVTKVKLASVVSLGQFWDHSGNYSGTILWSFWYYSGTIMGPFWDHSRIILVSFCHHSWDHPGTILGQFWAPVCLVTNVPRVLATSPRSTTCSCHRRPVGSILASILKWILKSILASIILGISMDYSGTNLESFLDYSGIILGPFWDNSGTILVPFCYHSGTILGPLFAVVCLVTNVPCVFIAQ